ncbi:MAG: hypothetical protein IKW90_16710 [Lachnospiraceae bacterium]|nr:hypothetical protein [Lachnospiraceae bacterium]
MNYYVDMPIYDYLTDLYMRFRDKCERKNNLCELKNLSFEGGSIPDYSKEIISLLYCLRYHFGYAFEYEEMYRSIMHEFKDADSLSVLSVGSGNGIDLWSLFHATDRMNINEIVYTGIDCVDWIDRFDINSPNSARYYNCELSDADNIIDNLDGLDILIFPKSISELTSDDLRALANRIANITDKVYVLTSVRKNGYNRSSDISKIKELCTRFEKHGFRITIGKTEECLEWQRDVGIRAERYDYEYPQEALEYLLNLHIHCCEYDEDDVKCAEYCPQTIIRSPILKTNTICCSIVQLARE